jgi:two-component system CheB/CheR fusion protein
MRHYQRLVQERPDELDRLFMEIPIGVTNFFRDSAAFQALAKTVLPRLLTKKTDNVPVRIWVAGCSSGEEAYSLAILLQEGMERNGHRVGVQIFATDLDSEAIQTARRGLYGEGIERDVSSERLARFFTKEKDGYHIQQHIRDMVIFALHNVLKDPPFTKLDLITCRNLLIYFRSEAQEQLLSLFHYGLNPQGVLFLGSSEGLTVMKDHYWVLNKRWRFFTRREVGCRHTPPALFISSLHLSRNPSRNPFALPPSPAQRFSVLIESLLLKRYAPASVVVDNQGDILFIHGQTSDYLEPGTGLPRLNILKMARKGLRVELALTFRRAKLKKGEAGSKDVPLKINGRMCFLGITVTKLRDPESIRGLFLVVFLQKPVIRALAPVEKPHRGAKTSSRSVSHLEQELQHTRDTLQITVEELQSINGEQQSTNEELQSANEEMETSREELQSLNEELQSVNVELQRKLDDLAKANDDIQNLLNSTCIATIFLDLKLRIKRFTHEAIRLIRLIPTDVGRPLEDLATTLNYDQLKADTTKVLLDLKPLEKEVQTQNGDWWRVRVQPYRTSSNVVSGLVLTFMDITRLKEAEQTALQANADALGILNTVREPLLLLNENKCVIFSNRAFLKTFKPTPQDMEGKTVYQIIHGLFNVLPLHRLLEPLLPHKITLNNNQLTLHLPSLGPRVVMLNARRLAGAPERILLAFEVAESEPVAKIKKCSKPQDPAA